MTPETKAKLSAALKAKWASGTRKPNPPEMYVPFSDAMKARWKEREKYNYGTMTSEVAKARRAMMPPEAEQRIADALRKRAKARRGKPNPPGPSAASAEHWKAKWWKIRDPDRNYHEGMNLAQIIRDNAHLFDPKDLRIVGAKNLNKSNAYRGISMLFHRDVYSWKGWVAIDGPFQFPPDPARHNPDFRPPKGENDD